MDENSWLIAGNDYLKFRTQHNTDSDIFGYGFNQIFINDSQIHQDGFKIRVDEILIDKNEAILFYKIRGNCSWRLSLISYEDGEVKICGSFDCDNLDLFNFKENSVISWHFENGQIYCLNEWNNGKRLISNLICFKLESDTIKVVGCWEADHLFSQSILKVINKTDDLLWNLNYTPWHAETALLEGLIGANYYSEIKDHKFSVTSIEK